MNTRHLLRLCFINGELVVSSFQLTIERTAKLDRQKYSFNNQTQVVYTDPI